MIEPLGSQLAPFDSSEDGAAGLGFVRAISETASARELGDILERLGDRGLLHPRLQLAHAGRVDEQRATRQLHQVPGGRRVAPFAVHLADLRGFQALLAQQSIDERRLPNA